MIRRNKDGYEEFKNKVAAYVGCRGWEFVSTYDYWLATLFANSSYGWPKEYQATKSFEKLVKDRSFCHEVNKFNRL